MPQGGFISPEDVKSYGASPRGSVGKVTMQEQGISRMLTINLNDVEKELNIK